MNNLAKIREMINRYFKARYGDDYVFRAPETFENALERWMLFICTDEGMELAEETMTRIEAMIGG